MLKPAAQIVRIDGPWRFEFGGEIPNLEIAYESWGTLNAERDNVVLLCPAFSAHSHARSSSDDPTPGWWEGMIGAGLAFDTARHHVICPSLLGSCHGTSGPRSLDPRTGEAFGPAFPVMSVRDMVRAHVALLDSLGIARLYAVAGGSLGGMEALELAIAAPDRVDRVISVSGTAFTRPYTAALRHIGRRAIMLDPAYLAGAYGAVPPRDGLRLARELGTLFYRSREEFNERFHVTPLRAPSRDGITFDVQSYLEHQGNKIVDDFDANSYLTLSLAMDLHDVARGYSGIEEAFGRISARLLVVGVREDRLIPIDEQRAIFAMLMKLGKRAEWNEVSSPIGHDAFLVEIDAMGRLFADFLQAAE